MNLLTELQKYLEYCEYRKELSHNTLKAYRIDLRQYISFIGGDFLQKPRIEEYITKLHKEFKQKTVKRKIASVKAFYRYLEEEEILKDANPFDRIRVKFKEVESLPRIIPREDIEKLLNYMYTARGDRGAEERLCRDILIIELFFATGIRVYELSNLKKEDIYVKNCIVRIMGKGGKERYVQIGNEDVLKLMEEYSGYQKEHKEGDAFFFTNLHRKRYTEQSIRLMIKKYSNLAGTTVRITPHLFRHSMATYLLEEGVDVMFIQKILGHSSVRTTQIYLHIASNVQMEILKRRHPRNKMNIGRAA